MRGRDEIERENDAAVKAVAKAGGKVGKWPKTVKPITAGEWHKKGGKK